MKKIILSALVALSVLTTLSAVPASAQYDIVLFPSFPEGYGVHHIPSFPFFPRGSVSFDFS